MHLIIDGYTHQRGVLEDEKLIYDFLNEYPTEINMTKITEPSVLRYRGPKPDEWGVSGFVMIAESHISLHTFVELGYLNIDVFSCKEFDAARVKEDIKQRFSLYEMRVNQLARGVKDLRRDSKTEDTVKTAENA